MKDKYNEIYKWRATQTFRGHWNPDAANISTMLEECFTPQSNLTVGQNYYPVKMLRGFSEMDNERVRKVLKHLIDESKDIQDRIVNTEKELTATTDALNAVFYAAGSKKDLEKKAPESWDNRLLAKTISAQAFLKILKSKK